MWLPLPRGQQGWLWRGQIPHLRWQGSWLRGGTTCDVQLPEACLIGRGHAVLVGGSYSSLNYFLGWGTGCRHGHQMDALALLPSMSVAETTSGYPQCHTLVTAS